MKKLVYLILVLLLFTSCDKEKNQLREGNKNFKKREYNKAEDNYLKALSADSTYQKASYNLANTNYKRDKEEDYTKAINYYNKAISQNDINDSNFLADILYNKGNSNFKLALLDSINKSEKYNKALEKAIEDYKNTLRINSKDSSAKHNLSLAMKLLEQNISSSQSQNKEDSKEKDKEEENKQKEVQEQNKNQDKERMLEALKNNEKRTLERLKKDKFKDSKHIRNEKDW